MSAALTSAGICRQAINLALLRGRIALSKAVYGEAAEVLARPKFSRALTPEQRGETLELLTQSAVWFEPVMPVRDCRDAKDNKYLELALAAGADAIVSGDEDLLILHPWRGIQILRPAAFLHQFSS